MTIRWMFSACMASAAWPGMLMLGFLANADVNPAIANTFKANGVAVSLAGGSHQFINQFIGVAFTVALAVVGRS